uniref:DEAD-box ATP-dependent RNA helicase 28 n=1 Tax=Anthurium amnicola TaxID=1678845 RepID=A0A1D1YAE7_9ARAE
MASLITCSLPPTLSSSPSFQSPQFRGLAPPLLRRAKLLGLRRPTTAGTVPSAASRRDGCANSGGKLVDEDMIVLRKRLHEMEAAERSYEPPSHWMGWERRYYHRYDADVCHLVGFLQAFLMNTRPSVALGLLTLVALSVLTSAAVVVVNLITAMKGVLASVHMG